MFLNLFWEKWPFQNGWPFVRIAAAVMCDSRLQLWFGVWRNIFNATGLSRSDGGSSVFIIFCCWCCMRERDEVKCVTLKIVWLYWAAPTLYNKENGSVGEHRSGAKDDDEMDYSPLLLPCISVKLHPVNMVYDGDTVWKWWSAVWSQRHTAISIYVVRYVPLGKCVFCSRTCCRKSTSRSMVTLIHTFFLSNIMWKLACY